MNEHTPLIRSGSVATARDEEISDLNRIQSVKFDPNGDPACPYDWPSAYKWGIVALLSLTAFTT